MLYESLQPDLFHYLLPICLQAWRQDLLANGQSDYGSFVENFWAALANKPVLQANLTAREYNAVETFMADTILDCIDQENSLRFSGMSASAYTWMSALSSFAVVFATLARLWNNWWKLTTPGQACAALQYLSCLLYENDQNPIFAPWTPTGGGGPPVLWETAGFIDERSWRQENVAFLETSLTPNYVQGKLQQAAQTLQGVVESDVPQQMIRDFEAQKTLLEIRLAELPSLLLVSPLEHPDWTI
jgi:hypothetical protein